MGVQAKVGLQIRQVIVGLHLFAHHVTELSEFVTGTAFQDSRIVTMRCRFLECNSGLNVVIVLRVRVKNVAFLRGVTVGAATVSVNTLNV